MYPDDYFIEYWSYIISLLLIYIAIFTPYRVAFIEEEEDDWFIVDLCIDACFFCDVVVNCFTAYYDFDKNLVTDKHKILVNYFKGWMIFDILACLPL